MNRLADETSPYLLQHADNPVDWYPWGAEALTRAREEDKPILLSIGYSACHWCHVMAHESFEDPDTAAIMNRLFVNVKVDREERPDLDAVYMNAVVQFTAGRGGWPMTVFLTPAGEPFHGGTYYPPQPRGGLPAFPELLELVAAAYRERPDEVAELAGRMAEHLREVSALAPSADPLSETVLTGAVETMRRFFDSRWGGFGTAPKFPPASAIEFLLRMHRRDGDTGALEMATATLDGMSLGGMYDVLGGGFARYSVDERWLVPHFEKMLYDNALLAAAYLHGWVVTGDDRYREVCERTIDFVLRDLLLPEGGSPRRWTPTPRASRAPPTCGRRTRSGPSSGPTTPRPRSPTTASARRATSRVAACCGPPVPRRRSWSGSELGCSRPACAALSRTATTRRSRAGTGLPWRRWRRPAGGSTGPTTWPPHAAAPSSCCRG